MTIDHDALDAVADRAVAQLLEHFDSVQIIATVRSRTDKTTHLLTTGGGCIYGRLGATQHWLERQLEETRAAARRGSDAPPDAGDGNRT